MRALGQKLLEPVLGLRYRLGPRDADRVEAVRARGFGERGFQRNRIIQKSRSA
jgi:hypothetical protein